MRSERSLVEPSNPHTYEWILPYVTTSTKSRPVARRRSPHLARCFRSDHAHCLSVVAQSSIASPNNSSSPQSLTRPTSR